MKTSKPLAGLLALMFAAAAAVAGWEAWRRLMPRGETALSPGDGGPSRAAFGLTTPVTAQPAPVGPATAATTSSTDSPVASSTIAEDEGSGLREDEAVPETAAELADLLPEPD